MRRLCRGQVWEARKKGKACKMGVRGTFLRGAEVLLKWTGCEKSKAGHCLESEWVKMVNGSQNNILASAQVQMAISSCFICMSWYTLANKNVSDLSCSCFSKSRDQKVAEKYFVLLVTVWNTNWNTQGWTSWSTCWGGGQSKRTLSPHVGDHNPFLPQTKPAAVQTPAKSDLILMEEGLWLWCLFCALSPTLVDFHRNFSSGFSVKSLT